MSKVLCIYLKTRGDSLDHDFIQSISVSENHAVVFQCDFSSQSDFNRRFCHIAKALYLLIKDTPLVAIAAEKTHAFLKKAYKDLGFSLKLHVIDILQLTEKISQEPVSSLNEALQYFRISPELEPLDLTVKLFDCLQQHNAYLIDEITTQKKSGVNVLSKIKKQIHELPNEPGVYIFYDKANTPIYIGKSIHLRDRVKSHFNARLSDSKELKLYQATGSIDYKLTNGEFGALLLESQLIKKYRPVFNKRLRRHSRFYTLQTVRNEKGYHEVVIQQKSTTLSNESIAYGVFRSLRQAKKALTDLVKNYQLCAKYLGLEKTSGACFAKQVGKCLGACTQDEISEHYNQRLFDALYQYQFAEWPYKRAIAIQEKGKNTNYNWHVFDTWRYCGSSRTLADARQRVFINSDLIADVDAMKYLKAYLSRSDVKPSVKVLS